MTKAPYSVKNETPLPAIKSTEICKTEQSALELTVNDAEMLVSYIVRNGAEGVDEQIQGVAATRQLFINAQMSGEFQQNFYSAFGFLAKKVSPVIPICNYVNQMTGGNSISVESSPHNKPIDCTS